MRKHLIAQNPNTQPNNNEAFRCLNKLARKLICCTPKREECGKVRCDKNNGVVPRYFGFYGDCANLAKIAAIVIGENPGRMHWGEKLWWQIGNVVDNPYDSYRRLIKEAVEEKDVYFYLPYEYIKKKLKSESPFVYYSNTSKCEYEGGRIGRGFRMNCFEKYLKKELSIIKKATVNYQKKPVVYLLGRQAGLFKEEVINLLNGYAVHNIPHPSRGYSSTERTRWYFDCDEWIKDK